MKQFLILLGAVLLLSSCTSNEQRIVEACKKDLKISETQCWEFAYKLKGLDCAIAD